MILINELETTALQKLDDAKWLLKGQRFDSAIYLCGYSLEVAFKVRLCRDAGRSDFPETSDEFKNHSLTTWKEHSSIKLAKLCSLYGTIKKKYPNEWSSVQSWNTDMRYKFLGKTKDDAINFIKDTETLLKVIL